MSTYNAKSQRTSFSNRSLNASSIEVTKKVPSIRIPIPFPQSTKIPNIILSNFPSARDGSSYTITLSLNIRIHTTVSHTFPYRNSHYSLQYPPMESWRNASPIKSTHRLRKIRLYYWHPPIPKILDTSFRKFRIFRPCDFIIGIQTPALWRTIR